jgi:hypothetical protein
LGGGLAGLAALGIAVVCNPAVIGQYREALGHHPPEQWISPTPGAFLRLLFGEERFWLQFVPTLAGLVWFVPYWFKHRKTWNWAEQMPLLLLVSFVTASYGAWPFDLVVLLLPVIQAAVLVGASERTSFRACALAAYLLIDGLALTLNLLRLTSMWFVWMAPALLAAYLILKALQNRPNAVPSAESSARPLGGIAHA